jgi:hypothetical protein
MKKRSFAFNLCAASAIVLATSSGPTANLTANSPARNSNAARFVKSK